jgi:DUF1365 family protein
MKINEFTRNLSIWCNNEEKSLLEMISEPRDINTFNDHQKFIIESLIRKNLLIKIEGKNSIYVYPNI